MFVAGYWDSYFPRGYWPPSGILIKEKPAYIVDWLKQKFIYSADVDGYIRTGADLEVPVVNFQQDGIVTPDVQRKLETLKSKIAILKGLKLSPNPNVYWYLVNSRSYLNILAYESTLQFEISTNKFVRHLYSSPCRGPKGDQGPVGPQGFPGLPGPSEYTYAPTIDGKKLTLTAIVPTPLDSSISIRLYKDGIQQGEVIYHLEGYYDPNGFPVTSDSVVIYDKATERLNISLVSNNNWGDGWKVKVRQKGPTGAKGPDGRKFLSVSETAIPSIQSLVGVTTLLKRNYDIYFGKQRFTDSFGVTHLKPSLTSFQITTPLKTNKDDSPDYWASVAPVVDNTKPILRWGFLDNDANTIDINLPIWNPLKVCGYGGFSGYEKMAEVRCCQEDLFVNRDTLEMLQCPAGNWVNGVYVPSGEQPTFTVDWGISGVHLHYRIDSNTGTTIIARTDEGISEFPDGSGIYRVTPSPWTPGTTGQIIWDDGSEFASESF